MLGQELTQAATERGRKGGGEVLWGVRRVGECEGLGRDGDMGCGGAWGVDRFCLRETHARIADYDSLRQRAQFPLGNM